jgi:hypothetical protein
VRAGGAECAVGGKVGGCVGLLLGAEGRGRWWWVAEFGDDCSGGA